MRIPLLWLAATVLVACSDDAPPPQAAAKAPPAVTPQAPAKAEPAATADFSAAQADPNAKVDPCDLSGYDMAYMTVDRHEELVKACTQSKR